MQIDQKSSISNITSRWSNKRSWWSEKFLTNFNEIEKFWWRKKILSWLAGNNLSKDVNIEVFKFDKSKKKHKEKWRGTNIHNFNYFYKKFLCLLKNFIIIYRNVKKLVIYIRLEHKLEEKYQKSSNSTLYMIIGCIIATCSFVAINILKLLSKYKNEF